MKKIVFVYFFLLLALGSKAQSYNIDRIAFTNFLIRMYNNAPFEGVLLMTTIVHFLFLFWL